MIGSKHSSPAESVRPGSVRARLRREAVRALWSVKSAIHLDLNRDPAHCVLLLGSARSGTTWLGEVLNRDRDFRVLFEPLRPGAVPQLAPFERIRYLRGDDRDRARVAAMTALLSGRIRNPWIDHTTSTLLPRRRLLKEIRANALAHWLSECFPESPLILMVRHPLDVVASRHQLGWKDHLAEFMADTTLVEDHLAPQRAMLVGLDDPLVRSVAAWAIETVVPLRLLGPSACVTFYEVLRDTGETELQRVLRHAGQQSVGPLGDVLDKPSRTAQAPRGHRDGPRRPGAAIFSYQQLQASRVVLESFALDQVYDVAERMPNPDGIAGLRHR